MITIVKQLKEGLKKQLLNYKRKEKEKEEIDF